MSEGKNRPATGSPPGSRPPTTPHKPAAAPVTDEDEGEGETVPVLPKTTPSSQRQGPQTGSAKTESKGGSAEGRKPGRLLKSLVRMKLAEALRRDEGYSFLTARRLAQQVSEETIAEVAVSSQVGMPATMLEAEDEEDGGFDWSEFFAFVERIVNLLLQLFAGA